MTQTPNIAMDSTLLSYPGYLKMYLNAVVFASVLPGESESKSLSTYSFDPKKMKAAAKNAMPSSIDAATPTGFISQIDLSEAEAFGVKAAPFAFRDCSVPVGCLASLVPAGDFFCAERSAPCLIAYHPLQSAIFAYAGAKEKPVCRSFGHERISALAASPDGTRVVAGMENGNLAVWCLESGELVRVVEGAHFQAVRVIRFSPDGQLLATGSSDALIKVWPESPTSLGPLYSFSGHSAAVTDLSFSSGAIGRTGRLVSCSLDGTARMFDLCDGQCLFEVKLPSPLTCLAIDAAETQMFCGSVDGNIYAADLGPVGDSQTVLKAHRGAVAALAWSPEERVLVSGGLEDGCLAFWEAQTRQLLKTLSLGQKCGVSGVVVVQRADVLKSMMTVGAAGKDSTKNLTPFRRVGAGLVALDESVPLKRPQLASAANSDAGGEMYEVKRENAQLRQINGDLIALLE